MTYQEIRHRIPEGIPRKVKKQRPIGIRNVLLFFLIMMILFTIFGTIIQYAFGMVGVFITELFFLIGSVLYVKRKGHRMRDVFPIRKPKLTAVFGTLIFWAGAYILMLVCDTIILALDPSFPVNGDAETITSADLNWFLLFFIVAVVPAICEEAMHRGVIQYGLRKKINSPWAMAFIIGLIFGLFHMDPSKFMATAILGGAMGWIMFQTNNMVYSSMFHFVHNGSQMILLLIAPFLVAVPSGLADVVHVTIGASTASVDTISYLISAGILTVFPGIFIPIVLYAGNFLLIRDIAPRKLPFIPKDPVQRKKIVKRLLLSTAAFFVAGLLLIGAGYIMMFL